MDSNRSSQIEIAKKHISESVFMGLCSKLGTSQQVTMRREVVHINTMILNQEFKSDRRMMENGSRREGFRLEGSDVDVMFWQNDRRVIWKLSQLLHYNTQSLTLILCDCSDSPPGFTLLYLFSSNLSIPTACIIMNYISSSQYRCIMRSEVVPGSILHGPCASGTLGPIHYDHAHSFVCDFWPPSASSWMNRCHSWPQPHVVNNILENGCHFVAIGHKLGDQEDLEWRISFAQAEQKLMFAMNHCQFLTYGLLKLYLKEIINNEQGDDENLLSSYHMKTAVFWVIQQNTIPNWYPENLLEGFWVCFKLLLKWVYEGVCPNFFIPENNMFLSKIYGVAQHQLFGRLHELYEKGLTFALHIPSVGSCNANILLYPRLSYTAEHTLVSEAEFDSNLFHEINECDCLPSFDLKLCMRRLMTIEQMTGSFLKSQYKIVMLKKLTASVLQRIVFILHMKTYTKEMKVRVDKLSCRMLTLAAKYGFISDQLYIAMYFYMTFRYRKALSILDEIKVKLAQPYVMHGLNMNANAELYAEAVGGQSWSTKMRQAVAGTIKLDYNLSCIRELSLEHHCALQNHEETLYIPSYILLYMLEILCCRHVDPMRVQTALDELRALVYDNQELLDPYKDISWQILGICQHITGNPYAALHSYQQSLKQYPINKIQSASRLRIQAIHYVMTPDSDIVLPCSHDQHMLVLLDTTCEHDCCL